MVGVLCTLAFLMVVPTITIAALSESNFENEFDGRVVPYLQEHAQVREISGTAGVNLKYLAIEPPGARTALVIVGGHHESFYGYSEFLYDIRDLGFSVYVLDPRGQGSSSRLLQDPEKSHVEHWEAYVEDLKTVRDAIATTKSYDRILLLGHSLGGGIAAAYLEKYPEDSDAAVLSAPLVRHKINPLAIAFLRLQDLTGCGDKYVPGGKPFEIESFGEAKDTHSRGRQAHKFQEYADHPEIRMGYPTVHWVVETARMTKWIQRHTDSLRAPLLVLQASDDAYVSARGIDRFCARVADCRKVEFAGSWHEMLIETDDIRDRVLAEVRGFLVEHGQ